MKSGSTTAARAEPSTPPGAFWRRPGTQEETTLYALIDMEDTTAPDDFLNYLHHRQPQLYHPALCR